MSVPSPDERAVRQDGRGRRSMAPHRIMQRTLSVWRDDGATRAADVGRMGAGGQQVRPVTYPEHLWSWELRNLRDILSQVSDRYADSPRKRSSL